MVAWVALGINTSLPHQALGQRQPTPGTATAALTRAMSDLQRIGTEVMAWWIETAGEDAFAAQEPLGENELDVAQRPVMSSNHLLTRLGLAPGDLPLIDPWGRSYEVRVALPSDEEVGGVLVRCAGADGTFDADTYRVGPVEDLRSADLVWADGFFVRWIPSPE